ncbi:MAG: protein-disulfide reductase DsbD domain-containing protein [Pseudomonadales bacterium]
MESEAATVSVQYQGCAARGFCYPPQKIELNSGKD